MEKNINNMTKADAESVIFDSFKALVDEHVKGLGRPLIENVDFMTGKTSNCGYGRIKRVILYDANDIKMVDGFPVPKWKYGKYDRKPEIIDFPEEQEIDETKTTRK